jgi:hypothetical protein
MLDALRGCPIPRYIATREATVSNRERNVGQRNYSLTPIYDRGPWDWRRNAPSLTLIGWRLHLLDEQRIVCSIDFPYSETPDGCDDPDLLVQTAAEREGKAWGSAMHAPEYLDLESILNP